MRKDRIGSLQRVSKVRAKKLFMEGKPFAVCGCQMRPGPPWNPECYIGTHSRERWSDRAETYAPCEGKPAGALWKGDILTTAWNLMLNNLGANLGVGEGDYLAFYEDLSPSATGNSLIGRGTPYRGF